MTAIVNNNTAHSRTYKERPVIMQPESVRGILDGIKTQTRRLVKPVRGFEHHDILEYGMPHAFYPWTVWWHSAETDRVGCLQECPYGKPGDRLWVRETWCRVDDPAGEILPDGERGAIDYKADMPSCWRIMDATRQRKWRPSIFIPRWASRITLEVTDVRVERLNDITEADAEAEGADTPAVANIIGAAWSKRDCYAKYWEHINGKGSWKSNPWVWVVSFRRISAQERA